MTCPLSRIEIKSKRKKKTKKGSCHYLCGWHSFIKKVWQFNMDNPDAVSRYMSEFKKDRGHKEEAFRELTTKVMT
ncbi:Unannotated [Lentimonas sp. CC19]|nr:Unannotated [Lentimonas sp. CC19]CAA6694469.1 Unannotated [Lentimonas sp. CC10]CAA7070608.1 Unannotated [Lentimonas sp. CC11]